LSFAVCLVQSLLGASSTFGAGYHLVDNFTSLLPGSGNVTAEVDFENAKVGLAAARLTYALDPKRPSATLVLPQEARRIPGPGQLKVWVKPDGSGDEMQFHVLHAEAATDDQGRRHLRNHQRITLTKTRLDFAEWRELSFDLTSVPATNTVWLERIDFTGRRKEGEKPEAAVLLDDLRLHPATGSPPATLATALIGPATRDFARDVAVSLDARSFVASRAKLRTRMTITDRNENLVADRDFECDLAPQETKELRLELAPQNLDAYLPPFTIACDVVSADLPQISQKAELKLVMANSVLLFDDFSDVVGRWFTAGFPADLRDGRAYNEWMGWVQGEGQRCSPWPQTAAAISRVEAPKGEPAPPGRFALRLDYVGEAIVYNGRDRYLPGNPFRLGVWVKGDGSAARLSVLVLDYTDAADFWTGGWKRINHGELPLCTLDFTEWRYVEVPLPGDGLGANTPRGSTEALDYPLEITAFRIQPPTGPKDAPAPRGTVLLGPIFVHTQQEASGTLTAHIGYDDAERRFSADRCAWVTLHNASPARSRKVKAAWTLLDRANEAIATGQADLELPPKGLQMFRADLAAHAAKAAGRLAPFRLQVVASDANDAGVSTTREVILARPDSVVQLTGFESDRGYLGLKAYTLDTSPPAGEPAARTSAEQAHTGRRSLALSWDKAKVPPARPGQLPPRLLIVAAIDPPLPGIPTDLSLWVHGDGSGALFYPIIGDTVGVSHGGHYRTFDLFLTRTAEGELQNAVRVDWRGWRKLDFRLPPIPPGWDKPQPVLGFVPSYPLGLHLALDPATATTERGTIHVDDITVQTHIEPANRLALSFEHADDSNVVRPGSPLSVTAANLDAMSPRAATVLASVLDWRGQRVAGGEHKLELKAGERREIPLAQDLPTGAFALRAAIRDGSRTVATLDEDILAADLRPILGDSWLTRLSDEMALRAAIRDRFTFVDEDWDWVEHHPGNLQLDSLRERARRVAAGGAEPYVLIGYSAYWAAGEGLEAMKANAFVRRLRDAGHAVDTFLVPERVEDWDSYTCELMRGAGTDVAGWVVWNNPDSGPVAIEPERFARMLQAADRWRRLYCPRTPLIVGGMTRNTAIPYLKSLAKLGALDHLTGVNVRLDVGRLSPEHARVPAYVRELQATLGTGAKEPKTILLTDLDWAVEQGEQGLNAFDQAAYLVRSDILLHQLGIQPSLSIRNEDFARLGLGLTCRREVAAPPLTEKPKTIQLRPAWWGIFRTRQWLEQLDAPTEAEVQDVVPGRTRCLLYRRKADGRHAAVVWRNDEPGHLSFSHTGLSVESAEDMFGSPVPCQGEWHSIGKLPTLFFLRPSQQPQSATVGSPTAATAGQASRGTFMALATVWVRDGAEPEWPQRVLAAFTPATGQPHGYAQTGGEAATLAGRTPTGDELQCQGIKFANGGSESFSVSVPKDADLVLRKRFWLDDKGQQAEVLVNGKPAGLWNLTRTAPELAGGFREAIFFVGRTVLEGKTTAAIELRYKGPATTVAWRVFEYRGGEFPLSAVGFIHADQNVASPCLGRNVIGGPLAVSQKRFANGIGVFAQSLLELPLNRQFSRFVTKVGVDAATEGRGSVVFEIHGDGKKLWSSAVMSGLDGPKTTELDIKGVDRLRLVVTDAGDGNNFDAADWCEPALLR
jgi:hypothetical protein